MKSQSDAAGSSRLDLGDWESRDELAARSTLFKTAYVSQASCVALSQIGRKISQKR